MSTAQIRRTVKDGDWQAQYELGQATIARQMWSSRQLFEVMVDFWSNHLNVTNPFDGGWDVRTSYDNDVIRKHALGKFADMLKAVARHPAMLRYLDNAASDRRSVNENYGRELLELHTVGIDGGYNEKDVRNSAYIMTGRTVTDDGQFRYDGRPALGRPGQGARLHRTRTRRGQGPRRRRAVPALPRHAPVDGEAHRPQAGRAVRLRRAAQRRWWTGWPTAYLENGTAIVPVLRVLFRSLEFWIATGLKTRRPLENFVATARALGVAPGADTRAGVEGLYFMTQRLGQAPLAWGPPDGYPDVAAAWRSAHATLAMWNAHRALVGGYERGLSYPKAEGLVGKRPATTGAYVDSLADRLVFQKLTASHRKALLTFLGAKDGTAVRNSSLGGKVEHLAPLLLDSVYHALR